MAFGILLDLSCTGEGSSIVASEVFEKSPDSAQNSFEIECIDLAHFSLSDAYLCYSLWNEILS